MNIENKKIIIAFDGPDNTGKNTQIELLRKWLSHIPFVITDLDKPYGENDSQKITYGLAAIDNLLHAQKIMHDSKIPQISNRMHYTEYAYSFLRGGHAIETILGLEEKYKDIKDNFFTFVFVDHVENLTKRDDGLSIYDDADIDAISIINERFIEIAEQSTFNNMVINIHDKNIESVKSEIQKILSEKFPNIIKK